jgi:hypothetical protein
MVIQCSEGYLGTGQYPKNGLFYEIGEDMISSGPPAERVNSIVGMKDIFNMTARSKMHHQYPGSERLCSEFI